VNKKRRQYGLLEVLDEPNKETCDNYPFGASYRTS